MLKVHVEYSMRYLIGGKKLQIFLLRFIIGNAVCDAPIEIAGKFCKYFSNIGPQLAEKIPNSNDTYSCFLPPKNVNYLFLDPASS